MDLVLVTSNKDKKNPTRNLKARCTLFWKISQTKLFEKNYSNQSLNHPHTERSSKENPSLEDWSSIGWSHHTLYDKHRPTCILTLRESVHQWEITISQFHPINLIKHSSQKKKMIHPFENKINEIQRKLRWKWESYTHHLQCLLWSCQLKLHLINKSTLKHRIN